MNQFLFSLATGFLLLPAGARCQDATTAPEKETPKVTKVGEHLFRLGEITFDAKSREIRLPAVVNMREGGPIEYLLVHETGKTHESVLITRARPFQLQVVLKLLRYQSGEGDLFDGFLPEEEQRQRAKSEANSAAKRGDAVEIQLEWKRPDAREPNHSPASTWILDAETRKGMTDEPWILTGSMMSENHFMAEVEGSIVGIYLDPYAMFNMTRPGAMRDERWGANPGAISEIGQPVTVILRPVPPKSP